MFVVVGATPDGVGVEAVSESSSGVKVWVRDGLLFDNVAGFKDRYAGEKRDTVEPNECVGVGSLF